MSEEETQLIPIYICDDNEEMKKYLVKVIKNLVMIQGYDMEVVLATTDPNEILLHRKTQTQRSVYFFDVDLKNNDYDGFTLAKEIRALDTRGFLVFVTTHEELIFETFKYRLEAMSYLVKEEPEKLNLQIKECLDEINSLIMGETGDVRSYYTVKMGDSSYQIPVEEILFFETSSGHHKVVLHTENRMLEFRGDLNGVESEIKEGFLKVHRSYFIALNKIVRVNYADNTVELKGGRTCYLSRRGKKLLKEKLEGREDK